MFGAKRTISELPEEFGRQEVLRKVLEEGYSIGRADQLLNYGVLVGLVERVGRGKYRRISDNARMAKELHNEGYSYRKIAEILNISKSQVGNYLNDDGH